MENALRACCKGIKIGKILILGHGTDGRQVCGCQYIAFSYSSKLRSDWWFISSSLFINISTSDLKSI